MSDGLVRLRDAMDMSHSLEERNRELMSTVSESAKAWVSSYDNRRRRSSRGGEPPEGFTS
jgi:hypothetical protein